MGLTTFPPSYLYVQYAGDESLAALVTAYNQMQQEYLDALNALNLPVYTNTYIEGALLDWVIQGIYGLMRGYLPSVSLPGQRYSGPYNTSAYNTVPYNARLPVSPQGYSPVNDDIYRRTLTWQFYKGDGMQFTITWLKRRVMRFMDGTNGTAPAIDNTYPVSVEFTDDHECTITVDAAWPNAALFKEVFDAGMLPTPFQYTFLIVLS